MLVHMAATFRYFARHGFTEGQSGHISVSSIQPWIAARILPIEQAILSTRVARCGTRSTMATCG